MGLAALALAAALSAAPIPPLTGPVVDAAGMLDGRARGQLEELSRAARRGGAGPQLQFVTVRSLEGEAIEDYSIRVAEAWKIGTKGRDDGILVVVAREDRAVRIEVGGGLEGGLTDLQSRRIIQNTIVPAFRAGRYGDGLYDAGVQILSALGALPTDGSVRVVRRKPQGFPVSALVVGFLLLAFVFRILGALGPRRSVLGRRRGAFFGGPFGGWGGPWGGGGPFGGGGGMFGGGGGGGWGGGGGGFSGGGASGKW